MDDLNFTELFHIQNIVKLKALCPLLRDCPMWVTDVFIPWHVGYILYREVLLTFIILTKKIDGLQLRER